MDEHVDVVEVEICAATEVEIIKNVQLNSQVRGEISARARDGPTCASVQPSTA